MKLDGFMDFVGPVRTYYLTPCPVRTMLISLEIKVQKYTGTDQLGSEKGGQ